MTDATDATRRADAERRREAATPAPERDGASRGCGEPTTSCARDSRASCAEATTRSARDAARASAIVELDHVSLAFDRPILEDVSFVAREGETIVIVGESGTGKSTILKLILRLLVPDAGECYIDGEGHHRPHLRGGARRSGRRWAWCSRAPRCSTR